MAKVLVVEDDKQLGVSIKESLEDVTHVVDCVTTGADADSYLKSLAYDLIILDWNLPDIEGVDLLKKFRAAGGQTPVLMLTAKANIEDKEYGFEVGADDYLAKPFLLRELIARTNALLRRPLVIQESTLSIGDLAINATKRLARIGDKELELTAKEYALLVFFVKNKDETFSPEALFQRLWSTDSDSSPSTVYTFINTLRKKLAASGSPNLIRTVYGQGYRLDSGALGKSRDG